MDSKKHIRIDINNDGFDFVDVRQWRQIDAICKDVEFIEKEIYDNLRREYDELRYRMDRLEK